MVLSRKELLESDIREKRQEIISELEVKGYSLVENLISNAIVKKVEMDIESFLSFCMTNEIQIKRFLQLKQRVV